MAKKGSKKTTGTELTDFDERLAALAEEASGMETGAGGGSFVSIRRGEVTYRDEVLDNPFDAVVLDHVHDYAYYDGPYDPDNPSAPACWAIGRGLEAELEPDPNAPVRQAEACAECWANEFGSAETGRGKACKNGRRLALVHVDDLEDADSIAAAEVALLRLPPTSVRYWASYVKKLHRTTGRPPLAFLTEVEIVMEKTRDYPVVRFSVAGEIEDRAALAALLEKREVAADYLEAPYDPTAYEPPAAKPGRGSRTAARRQPAKKAGGGRRAAKRR